MKMDQQYESPDSVFKALRHNLIGAAETHPFDSEKYGKVFRYIVDNTQLEKSSFYTPEKASDADLLLVHEEEYLAKKNHRNTTSYFFNLLNAAKSRKRESIICSMTTDSSE